jgi:hypothetical protein
MADLTFKYLGKTYNLPSGFAERDIPTVKNFLKSFNEWKSKGGTIEAYLRLSGRGPRFDEQEGRLWRRLIDFAESGGKTARRAPSDTGGAKYVEIFNDLKLPKKNIDTLKTFTKEARFAAQARLNATPAAAKTNIGNPLVSTVIDFLKKNPNVRTEQDLFIGVSKEAGKGLSNSEIVKAAIRAHRNGSLRLLKEGRGETLGPNQLKNIQNIDSNQLPQVLKTLFNIFPAQIGRDFAGTIKDYYKDNRTLQKRALNKLKDYGKIRVQVQEQLGLGGTGLKNAAFQFDHPISFEVLKRGGDVEGAIRTNPLVGDVNQWKISLDKKLGEFQKNIIAGKDVDANLAKVEKLKNINQTLFGNLAGDFTIDAKGKINIIDYGAPKILDPQYNIAKSMTENIPLGGFIKKTLASGQLTPELTEVFGEKSATNLINRSQKLIEFAKKDTNRICRIFGGAKLANGGQGCGAQMAAALDEDPIGTATKVQGLQSEGGAVNRVKSVATGFLNIAKQGGKFGAIAAGGAVAAGLVKKFMNDDPSTYLSNENQQKNMLIDMVTGSLDDTPQESPAILDYQLPAIGGAAVAGTAAVAPSTIEAARSRRFGKKPSGITKTALKTLGRGLTALGTPAGLLATEPLFLAGQVQQGDSLGEIATNPFNYMGAAFVGPATDFATKGGLNPAIAKTMRLGISPSVLKTVSRRFGLPGLALSLGISGYETYDDYKNKRGWFSEE